MKGIRRTLATTSVAATTLLVAGLCWADQPPVFVGSGSSAQFSLLAKAALASGGTHLYTKKGVSTIVDSRTAGIPPEGGNVWIVWDDTPAPNANIWAMISVDSTVGVRTFFATPTPALSINGSVQGTPGDNLISGVPDTDASVPAAIYNVINQATFNAGITDIRPEDCKAATARAFSLGYGSSPVGTPIVSGVTAAAFTPVDFSISGTDPITGAPVPAYSTTNIGAAAIVVFINTTNPNGLGGDPNLSNINRRVLSGFLDGTLSRIGDLDPNLLPSNTGLATFVREPLSGTYNAMEYCIPASVAIGSSQENGVNPAVDNPLKQTYASGGSRTRVVGTGQMISSVNTTPDSLGYAFFSVGNFATASNTRYLTLDGVDPLVSTYGGGVYPGPGGASFANLKNGSYPAWSILRIVTANPVPAGISTLITNALGVDTGGDFVPVGALQVFRSHFTQAGVAPDNGNTGNLESGGDVGGAVYAIQADLDFFLDTGLELVERHQ
jgi:hypothetical protein